MSLTSEITTLVGKASELIDKFEEKETYIEERVQAAIVAHPRCIARFIWIKPMVMMEIRGSQQVSQSAHWVQL